MIHVVKIPVKNKTKEVVRITVYCRVSKNIEEHVGRSGLRKNGRTSYKKMIVDGL